MAVTPADQDAAFLREVDENLRADQLAAFGRRWGKFVIGGIVLALLVLAGFLYWQHHRRTVAAEQGEQLQTAFDGIANNNLQAAEKALAPLTSSHADGYKVAALLSQGAIAADRGDTKTAAARYAQVANDAGLAQPYRDLALVKQTMAEFDALQPQVVIDRLKPLAVAGNAFFGTAGEMVAIAQLRAGRRTEAGRTFAAIAKDEATPPTIRQRAVQMASVLGVDAVEQPNGAPTGRGQTAGGIAK